MQILNLSPIRRIAIPLPYQKIGIKKGHIVWNLKTLTPTSGDLQDEQVRQVRRPEVQGDPSRVEPEAGEAEEGHERGSRNVRQRRTKNCS